MLRYLLRRSMERRKQLFSDNALRNGDLTGCAKYLDGVSSNADVGPLWRQLAERALANEDVQVCYIIQIQIIFETKMFKSVWSNLR